MESKPGKSTFENIIIYTLIGISISLIIILSYSFKQQSKEDSKVVLYGLRATINEQCGKVCLRNINQSMSKINSVYEFNFDNGEISIVYDKNQVDADTILDSVNIPMNVISDEKVIMKCPEKCAYCDAEKGVCKSFS